MQRIIFSDIDGTIISAKGRDLTELDSLLLELQNFGCQIVWNSSKTAAEIIELTRGFSSETSFISENGSLIYRAERHKFGELPNYQRTVLGKTYERVRAGIDSAANELNLRIEGYADLSLEEISIRTGLTLTESALAAKRECSETILNLVPGWRIPELKTQLEKSGLCLTKGTRFYTVTGTGVDKGLGMQEFIRQLVLEDTPLISFAIGDADNDLPMIEKASRGFMLESVPDGGDTMNRWIKLVREIARGEHD